MHVNQLVSPASDRATASTGLLRNQGWRCSTHDVYAGLPFLELTQTSAKERPDHAGEEIDLSRSSS